MDRYIKYLKESNDSIVNMFKERIDNGEQTFELMDDPNFFKLSRDEQKELMNYGKKSKPKQEPVHFRDEKQ